MKGQILRSLVAGCLLAGSLGVGPAGAQVLNNAYNIEGLADGNYRFCSLPAYSENDRLEMAGMCFLFRKTGSEIIGQFFEPYTEAGICVRGDLDENTVTGYAVRSTMPNSAPAQIEAQHQDGTFSNWDKEGYLKVANGSVSNQPVLFAGKIEYVATLRYQKALLNLDGFHPYNAGTQLPPSQCEIQ